MNDCCELMEGGAGKSSPKIDVREKFQEIIRSFRTDCDRESSKAQRLDRFIDIVAKAARVLLPKTPSDTTEDFYTCAICMGLMIDPVTLKCGHTFTKACLPVTSWDCIKCGKKYSGKYLAQLKTTVAVSSVLEKWWKVEMESVKVCLKGNDLMKTGDPAKAIEVYSLALDLDPSNHEAARLRSNAYLSMGQYLAALIDAQASLKLYPSAEGYFQEGACHVSLGRLEDAVISYFECYVLDPKAKSAKDSLKQLICEILLNRYSINFTHSEGQHLASNSLRLNTLGQLRPRSGSEGSLNSAGSSESLGPAVSMESESNSDDEKSMPSDEGNDNVHDLIHLQNMFDKVISHMLRSKEVKPRVSKEVNPSLVDKSDFECPLCMRLLWQPVTTPCGHTFCRTCLDRCFDHQPICPLCKTMLSSFLAERGQKVTLFIENAIRTLLPSDYEERKKIYEEEMEELANAGKDLEHVIPLFVCTIAFPTVPCPLHIFEPRYRLMIRRCMEAGTRSFGMCAYVADENDSVANVGTMLEIRNVRYFPDGRSIVDAFGSKRFRILSKGMKDGYHTGSVEFLRDLPIAEEDVQEAMVLHDHVRKLSENWFVHLPSDRKARILTHFGPMPPVEREYMSDPNGPSWFWWMLAILPLETKTQLYVLGMTSLPHRLDALQKILQHIQTSNIL